MKLSRQCPSGRRGSGKGLRPGSRSGLTLIEVTVSLLLLATLLTGLLVGWRRHARQVRIAQHRLEAIEAADQLLADLFAVRHPLAAEASGRIPNREQFTWQTRVVDTKWVESLGANVVRLSIRNDANGEGELVAVDVLVPVLLSPGKK